MIKNGVVEYREKYICKVYNLMNENQEATSISQIPKEPLAYLMALEYKQIIKPFVEKDLLKNKIKRMSRPQLSIKYQVTEHTIYVIGRNLGIYK